MPKMKTHRGAAKRFRVTRTGKVRFKHSKMRHNTGLKRKVVKKRLIKVSSMAPGDARLVKALLPYA